MRKILGLGIVLIFLGVAVWAQPPSGKYNNMTLEGDLTSDGNSSIHGFNIPLYYTDNVTVKEALDQLFAQGEGGWLIAGWDNTGTLNINNFPADMRPVQIINTFVGQVCGSEMYPEGSVVFYSVDYKLWRCTENDEWTKAIDNTDIVGVITAGVVNAGTVISDNVITNNMLVGSISGAKLTVDHLTAENTQSGTFQQSYTAPGDDNTTPGSGMKITGGKVEAYGPTHTFGGTVITSDNNFLVSVGKALTTVGKTKRFPINNSTNFLDDGQFHIYAWSSGWSENVSLGKDNTVGFDTIINLRSTAGQSSAIAVQDPNHSLGYGIHLILSPDTGGTGIFINTYAGQEGYSAIGISSHGETYGGQFSSDMITGGFAGGPVHLQASDNVSAPTHNALKGTLWVTSDGVLYINTNGSTTWGKVGAQ